MSEINRKLAAIDVGTNSFHLIIVDVKKDGNFEIIDRERDVIRLGEGIGDGTKEIKPEAMIRAVSTMKRFKVIADSYCAKIRAVATSAVRESCNKNEFIQKVFAETGIEIEVIDGIEEARLIYLGTLQAVPINDKKALVIDIGGGSTEFLVGTSGITEYSSSVKIGAIRLTDKYFPAYELSETSIKECRKWVEREIFQIARDINETGFSVCIGSAGTIMSTGLMIQAMRTGNVLPGTILNNYEFSRKEFEELKDEVLSRKTLEQRKKIAGLDDKRADIIPAGIIILAVIFELLHLKNVIVSGYSLREGIIVDSLQKMQTDSSKPLL
jgi:exopolyphosphatase/guanosine-5'-triphosphate,3'-diphosphate pyrophosphatase